MADLYETLGIDRSATAEDVKRAYRQRARDLHPDRGGDEEAFKEVQHAYHVLSDPQRRARYDRFGDDGRARPGQPAGGDPFGFAGGFGGLGDVIDAFFGGTFGTSGGSRRQRSQPGRDVLTHAEVTLEEVAAGTTRPVQVEVATLCDGCGGSGSASGAGPAACQTCNGAGSVQRVVRTAFGQLASASPCPACAGTGATVADPCPACRGEGRRTQVRTVTVQIPAGVQHGDRLRVSGAGEAGRLGAAAGDLYVEVHVPPHEIFERDGRDLWCDVTIPIVQAALGTELEIPTLDGTTAAVAVPAGTQPGDIVTVRRRGLPPRGGGTAGDLHVRLQVEVPRALTTEEADLLREFGRLRGEDVPEQGKGLYSRLREVFRP